MSREGERVDPRFPHGEGEVSCALRPVHDQQDARGKKGAQGVQVGSFPRHVGSGRHAAQLRFGPHECRDRLGQQTAVRQRRSVAVHAARLFQEFQGTQDGIVLHAGRDNVIAPFQRSQEGDIQRFGAVFGKDDAFKAVSVEQFGKEFAAGEHPAGTGDGERVSAPSGVGARLHCGEDGALNRGGFFAARRGVIEIDHISIYTKVRKQS